MPAELGAAALGVEPIAGEFGVGLSAASAATSGATASLVVTYTLGGAADGVSTTVAAVAVHRPLAAVTAGTSTLAANLTNYRPFTASTAGVATAAADMTVLEADEFLLPKTDLTLNSWKDQAGGTTNIYQAIDEFTPSDTDYIQSPVGATTSQYYEAKLEEHADPVSSAGHIMHVRYQKTGSGNVDLSGAIYQGTTQIATRTWTGISTSWTTQDITLTGGETDAITDYDALRIRFTPDVSQGSQQLFPDALTVQTNLSGAVTAIDEDPDSPDASWLTAASDNVDTVAHVTFPTSTDDLAPGAGLQEFRVLVRKFDGTGTPTAQIHLYDNGSLISSSSSLNVTSATGQVLSYTWDASGRNPATIECRVEGTRTGGSPAVRATVEVGAIEWNATTAGQAQVSWAQFELPVGGATQELVGATDGNFGVTGALAVAHPLEVLSAAVTTTTAALSVAHLVAGVATAVTSVSGAFDVAHPLAAATNAVTSVTATGGLPVTHPAAGASAATTSITASLMVAHPLAGATAAVTTASAAIDVNRGLAGASVAIVTVTAPLPVTHPILGASAAITATASASLPVAHSLVGAANVETSATATAALSASLAGATAAVTSLTASTAVLRSLTGASAGTTVAAGAVGIGVALAGQSAVVSATAPTLNAVWALAGASHAESSENVAAIAAYLLAGRTDAVTTTGGAVEVGHSLEGVSAATTSVAGVLNVAHPLAGASAVTSAATGALAADIPLAAAPNAVTSVSGSLSLALSLAGVTGGGAAPWTPTLVTGVGAWLDASQLALTDGDPVSTWPDASEAGATTVSTGFSSPTFRTNVLNGLPVVRFVAASNQALRTTMEVSLPYSIAIVGRLTGGANGRILGSIYPDAQNWLVGWWNGFEDTMYAEGFVAPGTVAATTDWKLYTVTGSGSLTSFWGDGNLIASNTLGLAGPNGRLALSGYAPASFEEMSNAEIAEIVAFDLVLAEADREAVEGYLAHRYGLAADLPALHPYKSAPPSVGAPSTTVTGTLSLSHPLAGLAAGTISVVGTLDVAHSLVATAATDTTVAGEIVVLHPLESASAASTTVSGALAVTHEVVGASAGTFSAAGALIVGSAIAGSTGAVSTAGASLDVAHSLAAATDANTTVASEIVVLRRLEAVSAATTSATATLNAQWTLEGRSDAIHSTTAGLVGGRLLDGVAAAESSAQGGLAVAHPVVGLTSSTSSASGELGVNLALAGVAGTSTSVTGTLQVAVGLAAESAAITVATGDLLVVADLAGTTSAISTASGTLGLTIELAGRLGLEWIYPDGFLTQTNFVGTVGQLQDNPDYADDEWVTLSSGVGVLRMSFPTPEEPLEPGESQEFRILVRPR